jgi:tetratricopeptide (TPR) repeat protein
MADIFLSCEVQALAGTASVEARDHYLRGQADWDLARVIAACSKAIEIDPGFARAYKTRAVAYYRSKLYDRAIDDLSKLIEMEPGYFGGYSLRGLTRVRLKDYDGAIADFDKAIALETEHCGTYYGRGLAYHGKAAYDAAIANYTKAIETALEGGPAPAHYYFQRARAHEARGLTEDKPCAEIDYVRALWADPSCVAAEEGLARLRGDAPAARPA